jgi:hypothetical protein
VTRRRPPRAWLRACVLGVLVLSGLALVGCPAASDAFGALADARADAADGAAPDVARADGLPDLLVAEVGAPDLGPPPDAGVDTGAPQDGAGGCRSDADCDDGAACTIDLCGAGGACRHEPRTGAVCDDGDACTTGETCDAAGACAGGAPVPVPADPCLGCTCDPRTGVRCAPLAPAALCDDGDCCTHSDRCVACTAGVDGCPGEGIRCRGTADVCADAEACTVDTCACEGRTPRCTHTPVVDGTECELDPNACAAPDTCRGGVCTAGAPLPLDDGNVCTLDRCDKGDVKHDPLTGDQCDDGDACTRDDRCAAGTCAGGARVECEVPVCATSASCVAGQGCVVVWAPAGALCDDGDACTRDDRCDAAHVCVPGAGTPTDDRNECTTDACDAATGTVTHTPRTGAACDDGDGCTVNDRCTAAGVCAGTPAVCDDGEGCTADACVAGGCVFTPRTAAVCDDGDGCTVNDRCTAAGVCAGTPAVCDDGEDCTADACVAGGCVFTPRADAACDDGDRCTVGDRCGADGRCRGGTARPDGDRDGYFDAACPGGDDCDDTRFGVNPGATEDCASGRDDDCDGLTDGDDPDCAGGPLACAYQEDCEPAPGTLCARWPSDGQAWCSEPCGSSRDCPADQVCTPVPGSGMVGFCAPGGPIGVGAVGAACSDGGQCRSGGCAEEGVCVDLCSGEGVDDRHCPGAGATCIGMGDLATGFGGLCAPNSVLLGGWAEGQPCTQDGYIFDSSLCWSGHCDLTYPLETRQLCAPLCGSSRDCPYSDQVCGIVLYSTQRIAASIPFDSVNRRRTRDALLGCYYSANAGPRATGMACTAPGQCRSGKCWPVNLGDPTDWRCSDYCTRDSDCGSVGMECGLAEVNLVSEWLQDPYVAAQPALPNETTLVRVCLYP